tara:strand:- start:128 stop:364 length:237 start_codon:yes stop_codon:yes gene_type:complete
MILGLNDIPKPVAQSNQQVLRMWFNVLIEYKDGEAKIIKSFSSPAKDSQVLKWKKSPTSKKKVAASVKKVNIKDSEEY